MKDRVGAWRQAVEVSPLGTVRRPRLSALHDVLLVEDSEDDVELTLRAFGRYDPDRKIVVVRDGEEALECLLGEGRYADGEAVLPSLILLDLNLPKLSGLDVLKRIRSIEETRLLPVVVLSTSADQGDLQNCYDYGANSYIRKPVDYKDFEDLVSRVCRYWLELNMGPD